MERTTIQDGSIYLGEVELTSVLRQLIRSYRFHYNNQDPKSVVVPLVPNVDGIEVVYEKGEWVGNNAL